MTDTTTEMLALADWIRNGDLAIIHCGELGACDANQRQRDLIETALRASGGAYVEGQRSMQERCENEAGQLSDCSGWFIARAIASLPLEAQESDGGHGGQPYALTDAVRGSSAPNVSSGKQEGQTGIEVGASQIPGSSMLSGQTESIIAGRAPGPSDTPTSGDAEPTFGCKRAGGFVDSNCLALCNCDTTMRLAALKPEAAPADPDMPDLRLCSFNYLADELRRRGATVTSAPHGGDFHG